MYRIGKAPSPVCSRCNQSEDTIFHILLECNGTNDDDKMRISHFLSNHQQVDEISTLNLSRSAEFLQTLLSITKTHNFPNEENLNVLYS